MNLSNNVHNNIVLIGFMASGKSSIGQLLASKTGRKFVDSDQVIERFEGKSINDIFTQNGEAYFRAQEQACIHWMKQNLNNCVISTGGGMPIYSSGLEKVGKVIYLKAKFSTIVARLEAKEIEKRPLAKEIDSLENLYNERIEKYESSAFTSVDVDSNLDSIVNTIIKEYNE